MLVLAAGPGVAALASITSNIVITCWFSNSFNLTSASLLVVLLLSYYHGVQVQIEVQVRLPLALPVALAVALALRLAVVTVPLAVPLPVLPVPPALQFNLNFLKLK